MVQQSQWLDRDLESIDFSAMSMISSLSMVTTGRITVYWLQR